ncbi:hypothetical protein BDN72DRAFT_390605 [Pluteus cervinus]|uniref:Uncharacterized protein n=1 Tax=Pluteus cervinus TaxID=181527 RepID=A0ACD3AA22_9AGAR|nr:hypothetical protein BDN72DRAFT_390605 [Pluteus cervinus]
MSLTPIIESPTTMEPEPSSSSTLKFHEPFSSTDVAVGELESRDSDAVSVVPPTHHYRNVKEKRRRSRRKPSHAHSSHHETADFTSSLAATGMATANPTLSAAQQAQLYPPPMMAVDSLNGVVNASGGSGRRPSGSTTSPTKTSLSRSPSNSRTNLRSPLTNGNTNKPTTSLAHHPSFSSISRRSACPKLAKAASFRRRGSAPTSVYSDGGASGPSDYHNDTLPDYYSGLDEGSSDEDDDFGFGADESDDEDDDEGDEDRRAHESSSGVRSRDEFEGVERYDEHAGPVLGPGGVNAPARLAASISAPGGSSSVGGIGNGIDRVEGPNVGGEGGARRGRSGAGFANNTLVTGFAVASKKRNADFHEVFPNIPAGDYLIEDYGCALQREILIQGRIYISENNICFHANIFGWITDLTIPISDIISLDKKMTAYVIPNAIQITTRQTKHTFASFLARDTTFDVIYNIWKLVKPEQVSGGSSPSLGAILRPILTTSPKGSLDSLSAASVADGGVIKNPKVTQCKCGLEGRHFPELAIESVVPGTPEKIYNLMFASEFLKDFLVEQKLTDIQISDWAPVAPESTLLARNMTYIRPLAGSLGPKQTKCEIRDEMEYCDWEDYVSMVSTTRTPDVPSGGVFSIKTRTCIMWASNVSSRVVVTTRLDWTGRSLLKGMIERLVIEGQKTYQLDLERAMRAYIQDHQAEFVPEGVDPSALQESLKSSGPSSPAPGTNGINAQSPGTASTSAGGRNAQRSTKGTIQLVRDAWDQWSSTTILCIVIVFLVFSNIWTLVRVESGGSGAVGHVGVRRDDDLLGGIPRGWLHEERERKEWARSVVTALWEELNRGGIRPSEPLAADAVQVGDLETWWKEVSELEKTLERAEDRMKVLKKSIRNVRA